MNADDSPTPPDAERFAAALEDGGADGGPDGAVDPTVDPELARELEIVGLLTRQGASLDPDPESRALAKRQLRAALEAAHHAAHHAAARGDGPSRAS